MTDTAPGPLSGTLVVDLSRALAGPHATMMFGDLGARVIKVEAPGTGDDTRGWGPPFVQPPGSAEESYRESTYFLSANRNKESITLNLKAEDDRQVLLDLVRRADVLVENFRPGVLDRLGLGWADLSARNEKLIWVSISGFGQNGPYRDRPAYDMIVQAMSGGMSLTGEPEGRSVRAGLPIGDLCAGMYGLIGGLAALEERRRTERGRFVDISMLDCQVAIMENAFMRYFALGQIPQRLGTRHPSSTPFQAFETADGHVVVAIMGGSTDQWPVFCAAIDKVELIDDPRYTTGWSRTQHYDELIPIIEDIMRQKTTAEWVELLTGMGVPVGPVQNIAEVANDPQVNHRQMFVGMDHPALGKVKFTGNPIKMSRTPSAPSQVPPLLGEHTTQVLRDLLGMADQEIAALATEGVVA
jgi:CoA:oxalate CoA-transferase